MIYINNCNELISFMVHAYNAIPRIVDTVVFQGDECTIDGMMPNPVTNKVIIPHESNKYKFVLEDSFNRELSVFIYSIDDDRYDQTVVITLPKYVKNELIATLKGEW